ncbi:DUF6792 domain-containing protein [Metabacillus halosaccharovorans]|uniref:DUF6792 domain-containing protein n=1 Tax=Metabacillus halosaccharovorans TaxID=930124 RepID=UPI0034CE17A1
MSNEELLNTNILRARVMHLEYENLTNKEVESEIRRIYYEETGKQLFTDVTVYHSDDVLKEHKKTTIETDFLLAR